MNHIAYINYFKGKASSHYLIKHDKPLPTSPAGRYISFFRMNRELEVQTAAAIQIDYPYLALPIYSGRLYDNNGLVEDVMTGFFEIRQKVNRPDDFDEVENARELCKQIGMDIIAVMMEEQEELGACGPIGDFDPNSVKYDFTGPANDCEYGCLFFFEFRDTSFNFLTQDLTNIFI